LLGAFQNGQKFSQFNFLILLHGLGNRHLCTLFWFLQRNSHFSPLLWCELSNPNPLPAAICWLCLPPLQSVVFLCFSLLFFTYFDYWSIRQS
jgi:hypothetical protein